MRRQEPSGLSPSRSFAEASDQLAFMVDNADPRPEIWDVTADGGSRSDLADIADRLAAIGHVEPARPVQVLPLRLVSAVAVEYLDTMVLAIGDVDPAVGVAANVVHDIELALTRAGLSPGHQKLAVRRIFVHARVAVAIRHIDLARWRQRRVSTAVERFSAHEGGGLAGNAEFEQHLAGERDLAHEMAAVVGQEHRIIRRHMDAVRPRVLTFAPRAQKIAVAVEHHHRMVAAVKDVDIVAAVDADPADLFERPAVR